MNLHEASDKQLVLIASIFYVQHLKHRNCSLYFTEDICLFAKFYHESSQKESFQEIMDGDSYLWR